MNTHDHKTQDDKNNKDLQQGIICCFLIIVIAELDLILFMSSFGFQFKLSFTFFLLDSVKLFFCQHDLEGLL